MSTNTLRKMIMQMLLTLKMLRFQVNALNMYQNLILFLVACLLFRLINPYFMVSDEYNTTFIFLSAICTLRGKFSDFLK